MTADGPAVSLVGANWEQYWFTRVPPHVYAALRILFGLLAIVSLAGVSDVATFWNPDGLVPRREGGIAARLPGLLPDGVGGEVAVLLCAAAHLAMAIGYRTRVTTPLSLAALVLQARWNPLPLSAAHMLLESVVLMLLWVDCGAVWSLDAALADRAAGPARVDHCPIGPLRLIRFQLGLVYLNSGIWKLFNEQWRDGSAIHYVMNSNVYRRFPVDVPAGLDWVTSLLTYSVLAWELAFVPLLLVRPLRRYALIGGIVMHLGMAATIEVGPFPWVMLASYVSFLDPNRFALTAAHMLARLRRDSHRAWA